MTEYLLFLVFFYKKMKSKILCHTYSLKQPAWPTVFVASKTVVFKLGCGHLHQSLW